MYFYYTSHGYIITFAGQVHPSLSECNVLAILGSMYWYFLFLPEWPIASVISVICYISVLYHLYRRSQQKSLCQLGHSQTGSSHSRSPSSTQSLTAIKLVCMVVGVYFFGYTPIIILLPLSSLVPVIETWWLNVSMWIMFGSSTINPMLYAWKSMGLRKAFIKILTMNW